MKRYTVFIGIIVLTIVAALWMIQVRVASSPIGGLACTQEAKICPDGSAVGRTGPNCEFAECSPIVVPLSQKTQIGGITGGLGISVAPLEILEDSRCPINVTCIQAGTVRIRTNVLITRSPYSEDSVMTEFNLGEPLILNKASVTLIEVSPEPNAGIKIKDSDYVFRFEIIRHEANVLPSEPNLIGQVLLGPTCPIERIPPDPDCAEKPYATAIVVYRNGSKTPFLIGNSNEDGSFRFTLPSGSYILAAKGGAMFPRCDEKEILIHRGIFINTNISCDTGIR